VIVDASSWWHRTLPIEALHYVEAGLEALSQKHSVTVVCCYGGGVVPGTVIVQALKLHRHAVGTGGMEPNIFHEPVSAVGGETAEWLAPPFVEEERVSPDAVVDAVTQFTSGCLYLLGLDDSGPPRIVWSHGTCGEDLGFTASDFIDVIGWREVVHQEDREMVDVHWNMLLRGDVSSCTFRILTDDGRVHWLRNDGWPQRGLAGRVVRIYGLARDVSEDQLAIEEARAKEAGCRELFSTIDEGVWRFGVGDDGRYRVVDLNPAALRMERVTRDQVVGRLLEEVFPDRAGELERTFREVQASGGPRYLPASFYADQRVSGWREGKVYRLPSDQIMLVYRDITDRVAAEQELSELEERLAIACQGQSLGKLAGAVAHDFNNKLAPILGYAQLVAEELGERHPLWADLKEIETAAEQARDLARQLLDFSRRQLLDFQVLELGGVLKEWTRMISRLLREDVKLVVRAGVTCWIRADLTRIRQLLLDFAVTANHALTRGGELVFEVRAEADRKDSSTAGGRTAMLEITLSGPTIDHGQLVLDEGRDTGPTLPMAMSVLSLGAIQEIVRQHEGRIFKAFISDTRVVFEVCLPAEVPVPRARQPDILGPPARNCETILLAEDATQVRKMAKKILEMQGYTVLDAPDAESALRIAAEYEETPIHLLLTDVVLPMTDGKTLGNRLQALWPELKVLYTSGHPRELLNRLGVSEDQVNFLAKPFSAKGLLRAVRRALAS